MCSCVASVVSMGAMPLDIENALYNNISIVGSDSNGIHFYGTRHISVVWHNYETRLSVVNVVVTHGLLSE